VGDAEVDQTRFLASRHHFDGMAECGFRRYQEGLRLGQRAHGVGGNRAHALRRDVADALAETRQAFERTLPHRRRQSALAVEALGQAHGFAQAVDDAQLAQGVARNHHVETVRTQVDRGQQVAVLHRQGHRLDAERGIPHPQMLASNEAWAENGVESPGSSLP
jgi:hypothetical protein